MNKRRVGYDYESMAIKYLTENGYTIIERNYRCRAGEIDIIARDKNDGKNTLVFIEVKYRRTESYGSPFEAVDIRKQRRIINTSKYYIREKKINMQSSMRYDVIGILGETISHIKNAFDAM